MAKNSTSVPPALVLGGGGFIGTALRYKLASANIPVTVFSRSPPIALPFHNEEWFTGDLEDVEALEQVLHTGQDIYHLISSSIPAKGNWHVEHDVHRSVLPTLALMQRASAKGVRRLVFVSSGGTIYGPPVTVPIPETAPTHPITAYGASKLTIESYLRVFAYHHGLDYRIARVANPYGPGQMPMRQQGVIANLMYQALTLRPFQIWGDGSVARDFVHVDDVASALMALGAHEGDARVFNVGSGQARTIRSIVDDIATVLDITHHPVDYHPSRSFDVPVNYLDIALLREQTGWSPQNNWLNGLEQTAMWMRQHFA